MEWGLKQIPPKFICQRTAALGNPKMNHFFSKQFHEITSYFLFLFSFLLVILQEKLHCQQFQIGF